MNANITGSYNIIGSNIYNSNISFISMEEFKEIISRLEGLEISHKEILSIMSKQKDIDMVNAQANLSISKSIETLVEILKTKI